MLVFTIYYLLLLFTITAIYIYYIYISYLAIIIQRNIWKIAIYNQILPGKFGWRSSEFPPQFYQMWSSYLHLRFTDTSGRKRQDLQNRILPLQWFIAIFSSAYCCSILHPTQRYPIQLNPSHPLRDVYPYQNGWIFRLL